MRHGGTASEPPVSFRALFSILLLALCAWVLSLPEFPSQDGPMHFYYAHIFKSILHGAHGYDSFFYVRNLFPPYAVHYYLLILLTSLVSGAMAEKLIVCLIVVVLATGFRYLAIACGRTGYLASLFVLPLLLNWSLGMGFFNFCLSLGFAMWALGLWWRARGSASLGYLLLFLAMVVVLTLTHPVPLLLVIGVAGVDLAIRTVFHREVFGERPRGRILIRLWSVFALTCTSLLYISHFTDKQRIEQNTSGSALTHPAVLVGFLRLRPVGIFAGSEWDNALYRAGLYLVLLGAIGVGFTAFQRARGARKSFLVSNPWLWMALVFPVIVVLIPRDMNGSHFFADRLVIVPFFGSLFAASAHRVFSRRAQIGTAALATAMTLGVLAMANSRIRPIAKVIAGERGQSFREMPGAAGVLLGTPVTEDLRHKVYKVSFDPTLFIPAYSFAESNTVLLNSPWLDLPILPLATKQGMLNRVYSPAVLDIPLLMLLALQKDDPSVRQHNLRLAQFLIYPREEDATALMAGVPDADRWRCRPLSVGLICDRDGAAPAQANDRTALPSADLARLSHVR